MADYEEIPLDCFGPVHPKLTEFVIAADGFLSPDSGPDEERRYSSMLSGMLKLPKTTLYNCGKQLNEIIAWEESLGIYGEYGIGNIAEDFYMRLGPLFMSSQYADELNLEGCGGFL